MSVAIDSAVARELDAFISERYPAFLEEWGDDRGFDARMAWQKVLHSGGWAAPSWPVEFGGRGLGVADRVACDIVLGRHRVPYVAGVLGINNVGPTLQAFGTPEQKASLAKILSGEELWCQGFSEPEAGSDLAGLRMTAIRESGPDGDVYVVNGQKIWTSQGMEATHCELLVRTDTTAGKHGGISVLCVPLDLPGIERRPLLQITGEADFAEMFFTDVRVPVSCLLGEENGGWLVTMATLAHERAGTIAMVSLMEVNAEELIEKYQRVDGEPVLSAAQRDELMQRYVEAKVLGVMGANSLASAEAGGQPGPEQSVIKLQWSVLSQTLNATKVSLQGLSAIAGEDRSAEASYLMARASTIAGGTTQVMKNILAERVLQMPREPKPAKVEAK